MRRVGHVPRKERTETHTEFWWGNLRERYRLEDLGVDGRIIFKWMSWTGLIWLKIGTGGSDTAGCINCGWFHDQLSNCHHFAKKDAALWSYVASAETSSSGRTVVSNLVQFVAVRERHLLAVIDGRQFIHDVIIWLAECDTRRPVARLRPQDAQHTVHREISETRSPWLFNELLVMHRRVTHHVTGSCRGLLYGGQSAVLVRADGTRTEFEAAAYRIPARVPTDHISTGNTAHSFTRACYITVSLVPRVKNIN
jgi:hypothetical protein